MSEVCYVYHLFCKFMLQFVLFFHGLLEAGRFYHILHDLRYTIQVAMKILMNKNRGIHKVQFF